MNMPEVMKATIPVFVFLVDESEQVYLQRRFETSYMDGYYEPPAGKMDEGEFPKRAACREALEEAGVVIDPDDIEYFHSYMNNSGGKPWLGMMFRTRLWRGRPTIKETEKCDDAGFFGLDNLPKLTPQVRDGIARLMIAPAIEISEYDDITGI
jgi:8-oxo-dGTP diphosphatase